MNGLSSTTPPPLRRHRSAASTPTTPPLVPSPARRPKISSCGACARTRGGALELMLASPSVPARLMGKRGQSEIRTPTKDE